MHIRHFFQLNGSRLQTVEVVFQLLKFFPRFLHIILKAIIKILREQVIDQIERPLPDRIGSCCGLFQAKRCFRHGTLGFDHSAPSMSKRYLKQQDTPVSVYSALRPGKAAFCSFARPFLYFGTSAPHADWEEVVDANPVSLLVETKLSREKFPHHFNYTLKKPFLPVLTALFFSLSRNLLIFTTFEPPSKWQITGRMFAGVHLRCHHDRRFLCRTRCRPYSPHTAQRSDKIDTQCNHQQQSEDEAGKRAEQAAHRFPAGARDVAEEEGDSYPQRLSRHVEDEETPVGIGVSPGQQVDDAAEGGDEEAAQENGPASVFLKFFARACHDLRRDQRAAARAFEPVQRLCPPQPSDPVSHAISHH